LAWPTPNPDRYALKFDSNGQQLRKVTLFNRGTLPYEFSIETPPWLIVNTTKGRVDPEQEILVSIDWSKLSEGEAVGDIVIRGTGWQAAKIPLKAMKRAKQIQQHAKGFLEADGYIAIEAGNFSKSQSASGFKWEEIPQHGRAHSSIAPFPLTDKSLLDAQVAPYVEYPLTLFTKGEIEVETVLAPSWPFFPGKGLRYAIAIGDEKPQIIDFLAGFKDSDAQWEKSVETGVRIGRSRHNIETVGKTTLRLYMVDSGVVVQKIMVNTGGLAPSYLGPPESRYQ
jgi:hypothetical protein